MKKMSLKEYESLTRGAELIRKDKYGDRVLLSPDGMFIKLFLLKRLFSSALFFPYVLRFKRNTILLRKLGIPTVDVKEIYYMPATRRYVMIYPLMPGVTLREYLEEDEKNRGIMPDVARFLAELHNKGIYFRAVHFGNILVLPVGGFGLIDVDAMTTKKRSLGPWRRARNFKHFLKYRTDFREVRSFGFPEFLRRYLFHSKLSPFNRKCFLNLLLFCNPKTAESLKGSSLCRSFLL